MANHRLYPFWSHLTTALRTGLPQNETKDGGPYPFLALYADPARLKEFLRAMTGESIIDDDRCENAFALLMSLNMLVETADGLDYTGADCTAWMKEAGFRETRVEHLIGPDSMVIGIK